MNERLFALKRIQEDGTVEWYDLEDRAWRSGTDYCPTAGVINGDEIIRDLEQDGDICVEFVPASEVEITQRERDGLLALLQEQDWECPLNYGNGRIPGFACSKNPEECPVEGKAWLEGVGQCWLALARSGSEQGGDEK